MVSRLKPVLLWTKTDIPTQKHIPVRFMYIYDNFLLGLRHTNGQTWIFDC